MKILVNDNPIDFQLEKTLSLGELLENIQNWAAKENMFILDYLVDGNPVDLESNMLNSENIKKLEVSIGNKSSLIWENLLETESYIYKLVNYLVPRLQDNVNHNEINVELIEEGILWVMNSFDSISKQFKSNEKNNFTYDFIKDCLNKENYVHILNFLSVFLENIKQWKKNIFYVMIDSSDKNETRTIYMAELKNVLGSLDEIASNFTIGKDLAALSELENIIDWISIGLVVFEKTGTSAEQINEVKNILNDLSNSLNNQDFVTIADIVDFDLKDALNNIQISSIN
jgi:hypothetical protein